MLYILAAIVMFGVLIALHEFGHFAAAKLCGVKVNEFSIGMGPQLLHFTKGETEYSLRALPVGGFCAMEGEEEGESDDPRAFPNRPKWQRLIILLAGVTMNFLTGFVIILCLLLPGKTLYTPTVSGFVSEAVPARQFLQAGDQIVRVDGHAIYLHGDIGFFISQAGKSAVDMEVIRNGERVLLEQVPITLAADSSGAPRPMLGINIGAAPKATLPLKVKNAWLQAVDDVRMVWYSLGQVLRGAVGLRDMSGPVGIISLVGQVGEEGAVNAESAGRPALLGAMESILWFAAFISINLAVMNLLPIPALDGGQILFLGVNFIYTAITKKRMDPKYLGWVSALGFTLLMALMLAVTLSDILKQFGI